MRCRSESVKRTVVDLSFSFFITVNCATARLPCHCRRAVKESKRQLGDISEVSPCEKFQ